VLERALRVANIAAKGVLFALLLFAVLRPDLPQFEGKATDVRLVTYVIPIVLVGLVWRVLGASARARPYPHALDLCLVLPFLLDTAGNTLDLFDRVGWFDDALHVVNWIPWVTAFGLALHYAPALPRWAHFGLVVGFGAVTHIAWELGEYVAFIRDSPELATAYTDTLGDLLLSLTGSVLGATVVVTALWGTGSAAARRLSHRKA